jgi:ATP-dependent Lhr-like helicase
MSDALGFGPVSVHHSSIERGDRELIESEFKGEKIRSIVATSSMELGIDIGSIDAIVQYGSPRCVSRLVQRVGRGGHKEGAVSKGTIIVGGILDLAESAAVVDALVAGEIERADIEKNALDVLANQICAFALTYGRISMQEVHAAIARAGPYSGLSFGEFKRVSEFCRDNQLIGIAGGDLCRGSRTLQYFLKNISVLTDRKRFAVRNIISNRTVASLDDGFVSSNIEIGAVFITKGTPWKVVDIDSEYVYVEPSAGEEAAIPEWEGEDMPVSMEISQRVLQYFSGYKLPVKYVTGAGAMERFEKFAEDVGRRLTFGSDVLNIESFDNYVIMHSFLGKGANRLLAAMLGSAAASAGFATSFERATPYSVIIEIDSFKQIDVRKVLFLFEKIRVDDFLHSDRHFLESGSFVYRFVDNARRFGVIDKDAVITKAVARRFVEFYKESPIMNETIRDVVKNQLDLFPVDELVSGLRSGRISLSFVEGPSRLALEALRFAYNYNELMMPVADNTSIAQFIENVFKKKIELHCMFCGFEWGGHVSDFENKKVILCTHCGSPRVAVRNERYSIVFDKLRNRRKLTKSENNIYQEILSSAGLVDAYGFRALVALSAYGVGVEGAARMLKLLRPDFSLFIYDVISAQRNFVKTRRFWSK